MLDKYIPDYYTWTHNMKTSLQIAILILLFLSACTPPANPVAPGSGSTNRRTLVVLAAASLTEPFKEIAPLFEAAYPGVTISFNFAGSNQLAQQLANGSPADVFASANQRQMDAAVESGRIESDRPVPFVHNRLVVIVPQKNQANIQELEDLSKPGTKIILAAKEVPVGQYSLDFLEKTRSDAAFPANYQDQVLQNVVSYEENVKAVLTKVALGEADAGIVYSSDVRSVTAGQVMVIEIPDHLNEIASYPIASVADSRSPELAQSFIDLVLSKAGQQILMSYGFMSFDNE
jgi:molybdate transport system substrate-binding protein